MGMMDRLNEFADRATELADKATDRARGLAAEHNDRIDEKIDRAAGFIDDKTGGKYSERIGTGVTRAKEGIDRFADQRESEHRESEHRESDHRAESTTS